MTTIRKYICDMCGKVQELPRGFETMFTLLHGPLSNLNKEKQIQALCPNCAVQVGDFITSKRTFKNEGEEFNIHCDKMKEYYLPRIDEEDPETKPDNNKKSKKQK